MLYTIVGMLVIILDQLVKFWVDRNINWTNPVRTIIPNVLSLVRVQNDGAAFSFLSGSGARIWFIVITAVFAILVVLALATNFVSGKFGRWCLVFVTAGGLSNMIDRIRYGYVIDMFKIELFDFAVFNVADIFITVFCIAFIIYILFGGEKKKEDDADEFDDEDYEEEDRPVRKPVRATRRRAEDEEDYIPARSSRKVSRSYEDEDPEEEDQPRRRTERSVAAAASAYSRQRDPHDSESAPVRRSGSSSRQSAQQLEEEEAPAARRRTSRQTEDFKQTQPAASGRRSEDNIEKMFASQEAPRRSTTAKETKVAGTPERTVRSSTERRPAPAYDPGNPFAEWEQANQRVSSSQTFNTYKEASTGSESKQSSAPVNTSAADDFDIDAILNEYK